jgi:drug/metabolite transporter (DMT)-like permease
LTVAATTTLLATLIIAPLAVGAEPVQIAGIARASILSVALLGVVSTALAAVLYFWLANTAGPAIESKLSYLIPVWAVLLGVLFLAKRPEARSFLALCIILAGVLLSQLEYHRPRHRGESRAAARSVA